MAEPRGGSERVGSERAPAAPELLRTAMEKVVFFEWRLGEMAAELAAAQSRASAAELECARTAEQRADAERETQAARHRAHGLEAERERLAALLARPAHTSIENAALHAERARAVELAAELAEARREIERQRAERDRWLDERLSQALGTGDSEGSLAAFISELRGEVIALRERQKQCDELLFKSGIAPPASDIKAPPPVAPPTPVSEPPLKRVALPPPAPPPLVWAGEGRGGIAASASAPRAAAAALADQCLRGLTARDPRRREQAARHLAAVPAGAAAPALATALGAETDARARAQIARALVACGGTAAADMVAALQSNAEPLVRLAALDALCAVPDRAASAIATAARDGSPAVRRRAAALAAATGAEAIRGHLAMDADGSVRAAANPQEAPAPPPRSSAAPPTATVRAVPARPEPPSRDLGQEAVLAVQTAIFGLTESELATALSLPDAEAGALVAALVSRGRLVRRGKRLVAAEASGAAAQGGT